MRREEIQLRRADVLDAVRDGPFGVVPQHTVQIEQGLHPIKEVFALATGIDVLDFNTTQARASLRRLGSRCGPSARLAIADTPECCG